jgi:hypothetical protein
MGTYPALIAPPSHDCKRFQKLGKEGYPAIVLRCVNINNEYLDYVGWLTGDKLGGTRRTLEEVFGDDALDRAIEGEDPFTGGQVEIVTGERKGGLRVKFLNRFGSGSASSEEMTDSEALAFLKQLKLAPKPVRGNEAGATRRPANTVYATDPVDPHYNTQSPVARRQAPPQDLEDDDIPF